MYVYGGTRFRNYIAAITSVFLRQRVNTATSSPADDLHHYVIPQKLLLTDKFYFQQTSCIHAQWEKEKAAVYPVEVPPP
jgi:hypothetical protein